MQQRNTFKSLNDLLTNAVTEFSEATGFSIVFGGYSKAGTARVSAVHGNRTSNLEGLEVHSERGLGGKALNEKRMRFTPDYANSSQITHDYDDPILSEGITALLAVPVIVDGEVVAMLYGGGRKERASAGNFSLQATAPVATNFSRELSIFYEFEAVSKARSHGILL